MKQLSPPMMQTHSGSCHCKAVRFEIDADIDHVRQCDCSICSKRGGLMFRVPESHFRLLTPIEDLAVYRWGTLTAADYFCSKCGVLPFRRPSAPTAEERAAGVGLFTGWSINTRCLDDFDPASVPVRMIEGSRLRI